MKTNLTMMLLAGGLGLFAQTAPAPVTPTTTAPKAAAKPAKPRKAAATPTQPLKIPAGAVKTPEGNYRVVDGNGKAWLYRETPWGVTRQLESSATAGQAGRTAQPGAAQAAASVQPGGVVQTPFGPSTVTSTLAPSGTATTAPDHVTAVADGDVIHFEKPTPFGVTKWQKNKSDLTPAEQKIWDREQAKRNQ